MHFRVFKHSCIFFRLLNYLSILPPWQTVVGSGGARFTILIVHNQGGVIDISNNNHVKHTAYVILELSEEVPPLTPEHTFAAALFRKNC